MPTRPQRLRAALVHLLGLGLKDPVDPTQRVHHLQTAIGIGLVVGPLFALFNLYTPGMHALGLAELGGVLGLLGPAAWLSRDARRIGYAEGLVWATAALFMGALVYYGGVEGTGLMWIYTVPFLAFFLKGQRLGWRYSLLFLAAVAAYFGGVQGWLDGRYRHSPTVASQLVLALGFYTLVAAAFNQLRTRFEEQLQQRVDQETAATKTLLAQLQYQATHDTLTGLPNRVRFLDLLGEALGHARQQGQGVLVGIVRVERLFELGNVIGPEGADALVRAAAAHWSALCAGRGTLARMRRDEFAMFFPVGLGADGAAALGDYVSTQPLSVDIQGYSLYVDFTQGLALFPRHHERGEALLRMAEQAMLQADKTDQFWSLYDAQQEAVFVQHHLLFGKLRQALAQRQVQVHFQPQVRLQNGRLHGAEALARWVLPDGSSVPPAVFIPVAEESGLIRLLTHEVIQQSLHQCARWHARGWDLQVSINLSALNLLDPELLPVLQQGLQTHQLGAHCVHLEITESCFMRAPERSLEVVSRLRALGFGLSIDDYGTGYSSLSYLKSLPIDELKIDQSFVRALLSNRGDQAIVASTLELAHKLGIEVVAEGVEDAGTAQWLREHGCAIGQGYWFAKPLHPHQFLAYAQEHLCGTATAATPKA
ncbi:MAG: putative bifunctional diguanylate cyclase/phosphodiesterase [Rhodoferax sp.]